MGSRIHRREPLKLQEAEFKSEAERQTFIREGKINLTSARLLARDIAADKRPLVYSFRYGTTAEFKIFIELKDALDHARTLWHQKKQRVKVYQQDEKGPLLIDYHHREIDA